MQIQKLPFVVQTERVHLIVGLIAFMLPIWLIAVACLPQIPFMSSISHFYYTPVGGDILVGSLSTIGTIMLIVYAVDPEAPGFRKWDVVLARLAGITALGVAFFPTKGSGILFEGEAARTLISNAMEQSYYNQKGGSVDGTVSFELFALFGITNDIIAKAHYISAELLFLILFYFSFFVFTRNQSEVSVLADGGQTPQKVLRNHCYRVCGLVILASVAALGLKLGLFKLGSNGLNIWDGYKATFWAETLALWAFGISWMIKGRIWKGFEDKEPHLVMR
jgi:hypothetical protein